MQCDPNRAPPPHMSIFSLVKGGKEHEVFEMRMWERERLNSYVFLLELLIRLNLVTRILIAVMPKPVFQPAAWLKSLWRSCLKHFSASRHDSNLCGGHAQTCFSACGMAQIFVAVMPKTLFSLVA